MGNHMRLLSQPNTECEFESGSGETFIYTAASMQGWRRHQEDRFVCVPDFYRDYSFFGVFDGHGGSEIAEFLRRRLHLEILTSLQAEDDIELGLHSGFLSCDVNLREPDSIAELNEIVEEENRGPLQILKTQESLDADISADEISDTDMDQDLVNMAGPSCSESSMDEPNQVVRQYLPGSREILERRAQRDSEERMQVERPLHYLLSEDIDVASDPGDEDYNINEDEESSSSESEDSDESEGDGNITSEEFFNQQPGFLSGSTATVAIINKNRVYVANVGDSRCVLSRNGCAIDLSLDHKPDDPEERTRIIGAGGLVSEDGRVDNCLNLSRAFGDFKFKGNSFEPSQQCITAEPFINSIDIVEDDDFIIIASDGIWNSMSSQEVVDYINIRLQDGNCALENICEEIFSLTLAPHTDNDGNGCDNMCCIIIKFNRRGDCTFIQQSCASSKVISSNDSLKQEENVNTPTCDSAEQITNTAEKTSVDEKSIHQNSRDLHSTAERPVQSMQHLVKSHINSLSVRQEKSLQFLLQSY